MPEFPAQTYAPAACASDHARTAEQASRPSAPVRFLRAAGTGCPPRAGQARSG